MAHTWKFFSAGGFDQVRLDTGADLKALGELDPKLWVALACPSKGLELDSHTLELLDEDKDGRVRVPEVQAATKWACSMMKNADELVKGSADLKLTSINDGTPEGAQLLASAKQILKSIGKADATTITPADTLDTAKIFAATLFNGDGIVPPESAEGDAATSSAIKDIIGCFGAEKDMSGKDGINQAKVDQFFKEASELLAWWKKAEGDAAIMPLKDGTAAGFAAVKAVRAKVDDFFARVGLASMDPRAATSMNVPDAELTALSTKELSAGAAALQALPLARIESGRNLPLSAGLNPAWAGAMAAFKSAAVAPVLGERNELTPADWAKVSGTFSGHEGYLGTKPATSVEKLGVPRLKELVDGGSKAKIDALIVRDKAVEAEMKGITAVDRLAHYHRDLSRFLNNFVAFKDFYTKQAKATFQIGTLYLDGRNTDLVMRVDDAGKHGAMAGLSMAYLAYCDVVRPGQKMSIVASFTDGDSDFLVVGRNGVFYDSKGNDWDATITKVVDQPISLRQAFWSPYKKLGKFVSDQIEKFAASKQDAAVGNLQAGAADAAKAAGAKDAPAPAAFDVGKFAGVFAAIGLAVGAIGTMLASIAAGFLSLKLWQMPFAVLGLMLIISGPSVLLAAMKLRQRNLAPLLDANGWAINARARLNIPFGASLTHMAQLPAGAERSVTDPYADKKSPWGFYIFLGAALLVAYFLYDKGFFNTWIAQIKGPEAAVTGTADAGT
jgi:hypothetical protein